MFPSAIADKNVHARSYSILLIFVSNHNQNIQFYDFISKHLSQGTGQYLFKMINKEGRFMCIVGLNRNARHPVRDLLIVQALDILGFQMGERDSIARF